MTQVLKSAKEIGSYLGSREQRLDNLHAASKDPREAHAGWIGQRIDDDGAESLLDDCYLLAPDFRAVAGRLLARIEETEQSSTTLAEIEERARLICVAVQRER